MEFHSGVTLTSDHQNDHQNSVISDSRGVEERCNKIMIITL